MTGEIAWIDPEAEWGLSFHNGWGYLHAAGMESQWAKDLLKKKLMKNTSTNEVYVQVVGSNECKLLHDMLISCIAKWPNIEEHKCKCYCFELPSEGARVFMEVRIIQKIIFDHVEQSLLIKRQHQQWNSWMERGLAFGIPEQHWRRAAATGQGGGEETNDVFRCLDCATLSTFGMLYLLISWASRAPDHGVRARSKAFLEKLIAKFCSNMDIVIAMDLQVKVCALASSKELVCCL